MHSNVPKNSMAATMIPPTYKSRNAIAAGLLFAISNVTISALQPVITRYAALRIDPLLFCAASVMIAAGCAAAMLACTGEIGLLLEFRYLPRLIAISMAGTVATTLALIYGLRKIDAISGVILLESEPIYSLVLATIFLKERPSRRQLLATATILMAIGYVFGAGHSFRPYYAALLILITPMFWQSSHVLSLKVMPPLTPRIITGARYVYAAIALLVILLGLDRSPLEVLSVPKVLAPVIFTGAFVYFMGSFTWYGAISRLSLAWTTAMVIPAVPVVSLVFAMIFLGEHPAAHELSGIAVAVIGMLALVLGSDARRNVVPAKILT
ncbi:MAG: DMT family transporter [Deltaproteobacteria bacterium]|nr:DMT family transporter [Deltaproteobacteria bacterium]